MDETPRNANSRIRRDFAAECKIGGIFATQNVLKTAIHVFYQSIPAQIQGFPAANRQVLEWATEVPPIFGIYGKKLLNETSETPHVCLFCGNPHSAVTHTVILAAKIERQSETAGFVCNCCSYSRGNRLIGLWIDLFVDLQWKTCEIVAFDPLSHRHLLEWQKSGGFME